MVAIWPNTLPQYSERDGYSEGVGGGLIATKMEVGPPKVRSRTSNPVRPLTVVMQMTTEETLTLESFIKTTLAKGALPFMFPRQRLGPAGDIIVRLNPDQTVDMAPLSAGLWRVTLQLMILP
jgi:hypothetical protein